MSTPGRGRAGGGNPADEDDRSWASPPREPAEGLSRGVVRLMGAAMDRARTGCPPRVARVVIIGLGLMAAGCAPLRERRATGQAMPPMLGRRVEKAHQDALVRGEQTAPDPVAQRLRTRAAEAGLLAAAPRP